MQRTCRTRNTCISGKIRAANFGGQAIIAGGFSCFRSIYLHCTRDHFKMYKPRFCVECGEKVMRAHWYLWTSRRFCQYCSRSSLKSRLLTAAVISIALIGGGVLAGRAMREPAPPLIIQSTQGFTLSPQSIPARSPAKPAVAPSEMARAGDPTIVNPAANSAQVTYICGARTKSGTPCTRRVHGNVRCYQHKGLPAMLPPDKLIVQK
jgi:hypothetical protein